MRGLAGVAAVSCYFYAIARLPLADAVLLNQSIPLFVPLVERVWLGEPIPPRLWRVLLIGFAGLLLILRPGFGVFQPVALVGLASAALASIAQVGIRRLTRTEPVTRIVFYFGLIASLAAAPPAALTWRTPSPGDVGRPRAHVRPGDRRPAHPHPRLRLRPGRADRSVPLRRPGVRRPPRLAPLGPSARPLFVAGAALVVVAATMALRIRHGAPVLAAAAVDPSLRSG